MSVGDFLELVLHLLQVVCLAFSKLGCSQIVLIEPLADLANVVCSFRPQGVTLW
jgi:hypothetical protein